MKSIYVITTATMAIAAATPAWAQDPPTQTTGEAETQTAQPGTGLAGEQDILVTAQRREQRLQDVPVAVSAFNAQALEERAISAVAQLSNVSPYVTLDAGTPFSGSDAVLSAYIRGIGANDFAFNLDPGV